jgi:hypothetical protein
MGDEIGLHRLPPRIVDTTEEEAHGPGPSEREKTLATELGAASANSLTRYSMLATRH